MKQVNKLFFLILGVITLFTACSKNDGIDGIDEEQRRQDSIRRAELVKAQAPALKAYVENPSNGWTNPVLDTTWGIWYEILAPGQEDSYAYKFNSYGDIIAPRIEVKYKGQLLNGTVFDQTDEQSTNKKTYTIGLGQVIYAWQYAFLPKRINYNGQSYPAPGISEKGLKKGSKIRFVTPSPWGYDTQASNKIPANSPLVFEVEVVNISDDAS